MKSNETARGRGRGRALIDASRTNNSPRVGQAHSALATINSTATTAAGQFGVSRGQRSHNAIRLNLTIVQLSRCLLAIKTVDAVSFVSYDHHSII